MLIDEVDVTLKAGHGGAGAVSFGPGRWSGPDGGNGGRGGDIYLTTTSDLNALAQFAHKSFFAAGDGNPGGGNKKFGKDGKDLILSIPVGTMVINKNTNEEIELNNLNQKVPICKGGLGGRGNAEFASPSHTTPRYAQRGLPGEEKKLKFVLKLIADYGLIGLPNAGKSSLLNELTAANAKVGNYPFTTLEPSLGVLNGKVIADIPGLIEGASKGKGLGTKFLKHIEKVNLLLHCISVESENMVRDYTVIRKELEDFNPQLLEKEEAILLTKTDLIDSAKLKQKVKDLSKFGRKIYPVSIYDFDSLEKLRTLLK